MMTMCPSCYELYADIWSKPCCRCDTRTISVSAELIRIVQMLIHRGFKVSYAKCYTDKEQDGKLTQLEIGFGELYLQSLFNELPPDWELTDEYPMYDGYTLGEPVAVLMCTIEHPPSECDQESIDFQKEISISNLETWLEGKDPDACKSLIMLAGCE